MMPEQEGRRAVVGETMTWIRTSYHHMGRLKIRLDAEGRVVDRGGVDCAQLIYCIFRALDLVPDIPLEYYPMDWHMNRTAERYMDEVLRHAHEVSDPNPGDIVLYKFGRAFAHGAVIVDPRGGERHIVHAVSDAGCVMLDRWNAGRLDGREHKFFSYW